jgi:hypothetical protein
MWNILRGGKLIRVKAYLVSYVGLYDQVSRRVLTAGEFAFSILYFIMLVLLTLNNYIGSHEENSYYLGKDVLHSQATLYLGSSYSDNTKQEGKNRRNTCSQIHTKYNPCYLNTLCISFVHETRPDVAYSADPRTFSAIARNIYGDEMIRPRYSQKRHCDTHTSAFWSPPSCENTAATLLPFASRIAPSRFPPYAPNMRPGRLAMINPRPAPDAAPTYVQKVAWRSTSGRSI